MGFTEDTLASYLANGKSLKPEMIQKLLYRSLKEYCDACESDRMSCVLSPQCPERILLKVRIEAGAEPNDLPRFCYAQQINNLKRYLDKKTTLYEPHDVILFNNDFIELVFPRLYSKIIKFYYEDISKIHEIISKSKIPAMKLDIRNPDLTMFRKIISKDKLIKEGTFIYDIAGEYLIIWFDGAVFITNFESSLTISNARNELIDEVHVMDLIFHVYAAEFGLFGNTIIDGEHQIQLIARIPFSKIIPLKISQENPTFEKLIGILQQYFFQIQLATDEDDNLIVILKHSTNMNFQIRHGLKPVSYNNIKELVKNLENLTKPDKE